ncbi:MAG: dephospho-CoA kinase [Rhodospirillaceae bacterium]|nr:dephospho-CoA kinase [Rhodospirillaceae bacterium]MBT6136866.1 dephospho-CoA kinase [Rhodospirillaceae bacterium]
MIVLGLTGSIGMGKSTTASMLRRLGVPVHDADACVHRLFSSGGAAVEPVGAAFPDAVVDGAVDRTVLSSCVVGKPEALTRLERIVHPLVGRDRDAFLKRHSRAGHPLAVLDVPLLFETGGDARCDGVIVVSAPTFLQRQRVLRRPGMTQEKLDAILARQTPDYEKRRRADWVIETGLGYAFTYRRLRQVLRQASRQTRDLSGSRKRIRR